MKGLILSLAIGTLSVAGVRAKSYTVTSPDGKIAVSVDVAKQVRYSVDYCGSQLFSDGTVALAVGDRILGEKPSVASVTRKSVSEKIKPVVAYKFSEIVNDYNQLLIKFRGNYSIEWRVFDDGFAYRFITDIKGDINVVDETFDIALPEGYLLHGQQSGGFKTAYEESYVHMSPADWNASGDKKTLLPLLVDAGNGIKVLVSESSLSDYPAMFLNPGDASDRLCAVFPKVPIKIDEGGDRSVKIVEEADYIAHTSGRRSFPWRYFVITSDDRQIIENNMTARLADPSRIADTSWIKPGTTTWEWWNGAVPYGTDVDFVAGCNTPTYKYFIDFASKYGVDYVLLDEGWAASTRNPFIPNDNLDLEELIAYGKEKNVGVILWLTWLTVENNFDLFKKYADMGVSGVKIDFMDRSDQWMVDFYERVAGEAAKNKLFVDFHGSFKPAGLEYKYPNVLSYEGVRGMEQMRGCTPENSVYLPFMRNAVGPMDYTPGAILSYQPETYRCERPNSGSIGTRAYQMALFVIFETGLQMLADNPTLYYANEDVARFMAGVPVMTDQTKALEAKVGEYAIVAKRKGDKWYIGGMTDNDKEWRDFEVKLDFLGDGEYTLTSYEDGVNAPRQAMHYVKNTRKVTKDDTVKIRMARNGGYAAVIE